MGSHQFTQAQKLQLGLILAVLDECPIGGKVRAAPVRRRPRGADFTLPWPAPGLDRDHWRERLLERLAGTIGAWRVWYTPADEAKDQGDEWGWPARDDLFADAMAREAAAGEATEEEVVAAESPAEPAQVVVPTRESPNLLALEFRAQEATAESEPRKRSRYSETCARHILDLLEQTGGRLSQFQVLRRLGKAGGGTDNDTTIAHTLAELVKRGQLTSKHDEYGDGYGLRTWLPGEEPGDVP